MKSQDTYEKISIILMRKQGYVNDILGKKSNFNVYGLSSSVEARMTDLIFSYLSYSFPIDVAVPEH
ncbi:MAG: hypothetical protein QXN66_03925 [Thermoplasmatales archaeon]